MCPFCRELIDSLRSFCLAMLTEKRHPSLSARCFSASRLCLFHIGLCFPAYPSLPLPHWPVFSGIPFSSSSTLACVSWHTLLFLFHMGRCFQAYPLCLFHTGLCSEAGRSLGASLPGVCRPLLSSSSTLITACVMTLTEGLWASLPGVCRPLLSSSSTLIAACVMTLTEGLGASRLLFFHIDNGLCDDADGRPHGLAARRLSASNLLILFGPHPVSGRGPSGDAAERRPASVAGAEISLSRWVVAHGPLRYCTKVMRQVDAIPVGAID